MHSRAIKDAVRYFLGAYWSLPGGCGVKVADPPGKPVSMATPWQVTIHDGDHQCEGLIGYYVRHGCVVTLSARLLGAPIAMPEEFLDLPATGFNDVKDALAAFLHTYRYAILEWSNKLADASPTLGVVTNMVEAPRPLSVGRPQRRQADWWGETSGVVRKGGRAEEAQVAGYSADIVYGAARHMQTETPTER